MPATKILVATKNPGKIIEIKELLANCPLQVVSLSEFDDIADVAETGQTFAENALIKAHYYYKQTGLLAISDDSGLCVDALEGAPGIYSARYAGDGATDQQRCTKLLAALNNVAMPQRTAYFICALALVGPEIEEVFMGEVAGRILLAPQGQNGFGYDPIFEYPSLSKSFAELSRAEKATLSHRGQALAQLKEYLTSMY